MKLLKEETSGALYLQVHIYWGINLFTNADERYHYAITVNGGSEHRLRVERPKLGF